MNYAYVLVVVLLVLLLAGYLYLRKKSKKTFTTNPNFVLFYIGGDTDVYDYVGFVTNNGLDPTKVAYGAPDSRGLQWYYDGQASCIAKGVWNKPVPEGLAGSSGRQDVLGVDGGDPSGKVIGYDATQIKMLAFVVNNGMVNPFCPV